MHFMQSEKITGSQRLDMIMIVNILKLQTVSRFMKWWLKHSAPKYQKSLNSTS
jgi:hypothetical protein